MKRLLATISVALLLVGCSSEESPSEITTSVTIPSSQVKSSTTSKSTASKKSATTEVPSENSVETPPPAAEPEPAPEVEVVPEPIFSSPGVGYQCSATDAWVFDAVNCTAANLGSDPSYDTLYGPGAAISAEDAYKSPSEVAYGDGGTCAAAICGYGTNSQGQRNPSSGEIQTLHGCQDGYITDPELCSAVAWVETHQY